MKSSKISLFRKTLLIYSLLIILASFLAINPLNSPLNNTNILSFRLETLIHLVIFIPWMFLVRLGYDVSFRKDFARALYWVLFGLAFSWITEVIQYFIPYRAFNSNDLLANSIGVLSGALFFLLPG